MTHSSNTKKEILNSNTMMIKKYEAMHAPVTTLNRSSSFIYLTRLVACVVKIREHSCSKKYSVVHNPSHATANYTGRNTNHLASCKVSGSSSDSLPALAAAIGPGITIHRVSVYQLNRVADFDAFRNNKTLPLSLFSKLVYLLAGTRRSKKINILRNDLFIRGTGEKLH